MAQADETGLQFRRICVDIEDKRILWNVSGHALQGHVLAVLGPSGSGKTTLINTLAGRTRVTSGSITLNGQKMTRKLKRKVSYVLQEDLFFPNLTLRETLRYSALLRLSSRDYTVRERLDKVEAVISKLKLEDCANTMMGNSLSRGVSGGEKKRANIGCELLTNPALLLLDEPTSGLDSSSALSLLQLLRALALEDKRIVVASLHQPSSQMYHMFDGLMLMAKGKVAYSGPASEAVDHLATVGLSCTLHYNPADYMLEVVTDPDTRRILIGDDPPTKRSAAVLPWWKRCCPKFLHSTREPVEHENEQELSMSGVVSSKEKEASAIEDGEVVEKTPDSPSKNTKEPKWPTSWIWQFCVLSLRTFRQSRHIILSKTNLIQTVAISIISALIWFQIPQTEAGISNIFGLLFFFVTYWGFNPLFSALFAFPSERVIVNKERASGSYRLSSYFAAKMLSELPLNVFSPTLYLLIVYWASGLNPTPGAFFGTWFFMILNALTTQSVGLWIGTLVPEQGQAIVLASVYMLSTMLLGGFYAKTLPFWLKWAQYLSLIHYSYDALLEFQFTPSRHFICATPSSYAICGNSSLVGNDTYMFGNRSTVPGPVVLEGVVSFPLYADFLVIVAFLLVFRVLAYLTLRFKWKQ